MKQNGDKTCTYTTLVGACGFFEPLELDAELGPPPVEGPVAAPEALELDDCWALVGGGRGGRGSLSRTKIRAFSGSGATANSAIIGMKL